MLGKIKDTLDGLAHDWHNADDDCFYAIVAEELGQERIHKGLWLKAFSKSDMDESLKLSSVKTIGAAPADAARIAAP